VSEPTDVALIEAWQGGDRAAGDAFFRRHFDAVYDFFRRKVSEDLSDLTQRTFLGFVEGAERYRGDCSPRTFLFAVARHQLYQHFRRRRRDGRLDFAVTSLRDLGPSPSSALGRRDEAAVLLTALESLPLETQLLFELRYWEGLRGPQLARVLEVPEGTIRSRLRRGLRQLRERVEELSVAGRDRWADDETFARWAAGRRPAIGDRER